MDHMAELDAIRDLPHIEAVWRERTYRVHRKTKDGRDQLALVTVQDAGPGSHPGGRYTVTAQTSDGKRRAGGNGDDSLRAALAQVHWGDLDPK